MFVDVFFGRVYGILFLSIDINECLFDFKFIFNIKCGGIFFFLDVVFVFLFNFWVGFVCNFMCRFYLGGCCRLIELGGKDVIRWNRYYWKERCW